ncbi:MAG: hypothetical protein IJT32_01185 [Lachnospiraceae bacterium]|nr:hypothetical protein [Lachnospiraceae bacterium]
MVTAIQSELSAAEIENYSRLQRIKQANKEENPVLDYEIIVSRAKLESMGINPESLTLIK